MSDNIPPGCSVPDTDKFITLEELRFKLENEVRKKIILLKEKNDSLKTGTPEIFTNSWLTEIEAALPLYLLERTEDIDSKLTNEKSEYLNLVKVLNDMNQQQNETLQYLTKDVSKKRTELKRLKQNLKYFDNKSLMESDSEEENEETSEYKEIHSKISRCFASVKKDMQFVVNNFFDGSMESLLRDLTISYFKGGEEQYIDVEDEHHHNVIVLYDAHLIVFHPTDKYKIKFDKFI